MPSTRDVPAVALERDEPAVALSRLRLEAVLKRDGNERCFQCETRRPQWASLNNGVLLCFDCAGVHRTGDRWALPIETSHLRSVRLDVLSDEHVRCLEVAGNARVRHLWDAASVGSPRDRASWMSVEAAGVRTLVREAARRGVAPLRYRTCEGFLCKVAASHASSHSHTAPDATSEEDAVRHALDTLLRRRIPGPKDLVLEFEGGEQQFWSSQLSVSAYVGRRLARRSPHLLRDAARERIALAMLARRAEGWTSDPTADAQPEPPSKPPERVRASRAARPAMRRPSRRRTLGAVRLSDPARKEHGSSLSAPSAAESEEWPMVPAGGTDPWGLHEDLELA
jgi:hypothetical protein